MSRAEKRKLDSVCGHYIHRMFCEVITHPREEQSWINDVALEIADRTWVFSCRGDGSILAQPGSLGIRPFDGLAIEVFEVPTVPQQQVLRVSVTDNSVLLHCEATLIEIMNCEDELEVSIDGDRLSVDMIMPPEVDPL